MADIVLINPRFDVSYWGMEHAMPILGKRANLPTAGLPLLAALTPDEHEITIIDENVEAIDFKRCARADIVGVTGMIVQRFRMKEILTELKRQDTFTVVGGPWVTVSEDYFGNLADVIFVGEAEQTWPTFLADWAEGRHQRRYEQTERTDLTTLPVPRFDLMRMRDYAFGSVQFSRGCPFRCEFCDIIVVFGRRPRIKTGEQVIAELDALRRHGIGIAFIVDDNLIGNKKAIKPILRTVIDWQAANGYPMVFFTEASLDLADDDELMQLMVEANILSVFVGIETPNEAALRETGKVQNLRRGGTMLDRVRRIQRAGMEVWSGMIVGFDNDDAGIFEQQRRFVEQALIVSAMVGMLVAIPKTPLHKRLASEGRLDPSDRPAFGTNVIPKRIDRADLSAGYVKLFATLNEPAGYFRRLDALYLGGGLGRDNGQTAYWRDHPWRRRGAMALYLAMAAGLFARLMRRIPDAALRREYRGRIWNFLKRRPDPSILILYVIRCAMHYHAHVMTRQMAAGERPVANSF